MNLRVLVWGVAFSLSLPLDCASAQPVFPLPTREQRLGADPQTPLSDLMELVRTASPPVRTAALQTLVERKSPEAIKALRELATPYEKDADIRRILFLLENSPGKRAEADELLTYLQQNQQWNYATTEFSGAMLRLAHLGDARSLPLIEKYLQRPPELHTPLMDDPDVGRDRAALEKPYWQMRWRGYALAQKIAYFKAYCLAVDGNEKANAISSLL